MVTATRDTSADSAARFLASRAGKATPYRRSRSSPHTNVPPSRPLIVSCCGFRRQARNVVLVDGRMVCAPGKGCLHTSGPRRIAVDFAEPTLRAIHEALLDRLEAGDMDGVRHNLTVIAEQMIGAALGEPSAWPDDQPLTDREVP